MLDFELLLGNFPALINGHLRTCYVHWRGVLCRNLHAGMQTHKACKNLINKEKNTLLLLSHINNQISYKSYEFR